MVAQVENQVTVVSYQKPVRIKAIYVVPGQEVKKGDKLKTKDSIGKIATDPLNGQTILSFSIFNNGIPQNPRFWIYKM